MLVVLIFDVSYLLNNYNCHFDLSTTDAFARNTSFYGQSSMPILLDQISCTGTELDINGCRTKEWGYHSCDNNNEAGVLCSLYLYHYVINLTKVNFKRIVRTWMSNPPP